MNFKRLAPVIKSIAANPQRFDMLTVKWNTGARRDLAAFVAEVAVGEPIGRKTKVHYRGQEMHVSDVAVIFLELTDAEAELLFYPMSWPDDVWSNVCNGDSLMALVLILRRNFNLIIPKQ